MKIDRLKAKCKGAPPPADVQNLIKELQVSATQGHEALAQKLSNIQVWKYSKVGLKWVVCGDQLLWRDPTRIASAFVCSATAECSCCAAEQPMVESELTILVAIHRTQSDFYYWHDIVDLFDDILAQATAEAAYSVALRDSDTISGGETSRWYMQIDIPQNDSLRNVVCEILHFFSLLIENTFSRSSFSSIDRLYNLLYSDNLNVVYNVLVLLYTFARRSNLFGRLQDKQKRDIFSVLHMLASPWTNTAVSFTLAACCSRRQPLPTDATCIKFQCQAKSSTTEAGGSATETQRIMIDTDVADRAQMPTAQLMHVILKTCGQELSPNSTTLPELDEKHQQKLYLLIRLAKHFTDPTSRVMNVQVRLQALTVLLHNNALNQSKKFLYTGFLGELVDILKLDEDDLADIKTCVLRTLTAIIHYSNAEPERLNSVLQATGLASPYGTIPSIVRDCVSYLTANSVTAGNVMPSSSSSATSSAEKAALARRFPVQYTTAIFSFLYHISNYGSGIDALTNADMMQTMLRIINHYESTDESLGFATRAVRVVDLLANNNLTLFRNASGFSCMTARLAHEVQCCLQESQQQQAADAAANASPSATVHTCHPQRAALMKSALSFLKKAFPDAAFNDNANLRDVFGEETRNALKSIVERCEFFGPSLFLMTLDVITSFINAEPASLSDFQASGLTKAILDAVFTRKLPATREIITSLPHTCTALCTNARGVEEFRSVAPFDRICQILLSEEYLSALRRKKTTAMDATRLRGNEPAQALGSTLEQLAQHYPVLRQDAVRAVVNMLNRLVEMGNGIAPAAVSNNATATTSSNAFTQLPTTHHGLLNVIRLQQANSSFSAAFANATATATSSVAQGQVNDLTSLRNVGLSISMQIQEQIQEQLRQMETTASPSSAMQQQQQQPMPMASASSNNRALVLDDPGLGLRHNESVQSMGGNAVDLIDFDQDDDESSTPTSSPPGVSYDMSDLTSAVGAGTSGSSALLPPLPSTVASSSAESAQSSGNASNNADTEMTDQSSAQSSTPQPPSAVAGQQVVPPVAVSVETVPSTIGNGTLQQSPPYSSSAAAVGTDLNSLQFMDHDMAESARVIANILGSVTSAASLAATEPYGAGVAQAAQQQQTLLASPMPVQSATLAEIISNVACFTEAFINNANMRPDATARNVQDFAAQNGIKAVVSLLKLNNVALDFPLHSACSALAKLVRTLHNGWNNGSPSALLNAGSGKLLDDILESLRNLIDEGVRLMRSNVSENTSNIGSNPTQLTGELAVQTALSRELLAVRACSIASSKALLKYTSTLDSNAFSMSDRCPLAQKLTQIHTHIYVLSSLCKSSARQISSSNANSISSSFVLNPLAPQLVSYMIALYDMLVWESVSLVSLGEIQPTIVRSTTAMITPGTMAVQAAALAAASTASPFSIENILFNSNNMASPMVTSASSAGSQNASNMPPLVNSDVASYSISQPQFISNGSSASTSSFDALNLMVNAALAAETTAAPNAPSMQSSMDINTSGKQRGTTDVVKLMQPTLTIVTKLSCAIGDLLQAICRMPYQQQLQQRHRRNRQGALIQQAQQQGLLNQANDKLFKSLATSMKQSLLWEPPSGAVNKNEEVSLAATRRQTDMRHMYLACIVSMLGKMLVSDSRQAFGDTLQAMIREGTLDVCSKLYYWSLKPLNLLNGASSGDFTDISDDAGDERRKSNRADQQQPPLVMSSAQSEFLAHWLELAQLLANKRVVVDSSHSVMQPSSSPARGAENRSSTPSPMTAEQTAANNRDALVAIHKYVVPILKQFYQHTDLYCTLPSPIPAHYFSLLRAVLSSSDLVTSHIARQQASAAAAASVAASVAEQLSSSSSASTSASAPSSSSTATIDLAETSAGVTSNPSIPTSSATGPGNLPTVAEVSGDTTSSASSIGNSSQQSFADFIAAATAALSAGGASSSVRPLATAGTSSIPTESDNSAAVIQPTSAAAGQQPPPPPQPSSAVDVEQQRQNAITSVCEMGFDRPTAIRALHLNDWQVEAAVNLLLTLQPAQLQAMAAVYDDDDDLMLSIERYGAPLPPPPPPLPHLSRSGTSLVADGSASDQNTAAVDTGRRVSVTSSPADILTEAADVRDTVAVYQASLNEDDYKSLRSDVVPLINIMSFLASKNTSSGNLSSVSRPSNTVTTSPVTAKYSADIVFRVVDIVQLCARQNGPEWREQLIVLVVERIVEYVEYVSRAFRTGVETCIEPDKLVQVIQQFDQNEPTSNKLEAFMHFAALLLERSSGKPYWHVIFNTSVKNGDGGAQQQPLYQQFHQSLMSLVSTARYVLQQVKCGAVQAPQWLTLAFLLLDLSDRQCLAQQRNAHARERYSSGRWKYFDVKTSRWLPFDVAQCEDINKAFDEGKNDAQITFDMGPASAVQQQTSQRSTPFSTVYFDHMVMINHRTNTRRPVMRDLDEFDAAYEAAKSSKIAKLSGIGMKAPASMPSDLGKSGKREDTQSNGSSTDKDSAQKKRQKSSSDSSMQSQQPSPAARRTVKLLKRAHAGGARGGSARKNVPTAMSAQRGSNKTAFPLTSKTSSAGPKLQQQGESTPQQQQPQSDAATSALSDDCFAPPYSISALSKDEQHAIMLDSIELIKAGHPLLLNAIMRYMLRLTRSPSNAVFFVKSGGLRALFGLSRAAYFPEFTSLLTHIVRHVIEQPPVLIKRMVDVVDFILHNVYSKSIANPAIQGIAGTPTANDLNNDLFIALNRLWPAGLRSPYMMEQVAKRLIGVTALPGIVSASSSGDTGASGSTASIAEKLVVERRPATQLHQYHHNQPSTPHQQRVRFAGNMPSSAELHGRTPLRQQPTATPTSRHAGLQFSFDATTNTSAAASCTNAATSGGNAFEELFMRHSDQVSYDAMIRGVVEDMLSLLLIRPAAGSNGLRSGVSPLALLVKNNQLTASVPNGEDAHMEDVSGNHTMQTDGGGETSAKTLSSRAMFDNNVGVSCVLSRSNVLDMMALLLQQYPLVLTHIANAVVVESTTGAAPRVTTLLTATAMDETVKNSNAAGRETSVELGCDIGLQAMNAGGDKITSAVTYILDNLLTERDLMAQAIRDELNSIPAQEVLQGGRSVLDTEMSATSRTRSVLVAAANGDGSSTSQSAPPPSTIALDNAAPPQSSLNAYFNSNNNCSHYSQSDIEECCASANYFFRAIASTTEAPNSQFRVVEDIRKLFGIYAQRLFSCSREEKNKNDVESLMMAPAVTTNNTTAAAPNGMVIDGNSLSSPEEARKVTLPVSISATNDESSRKTTTAVLAGDIAHKLKALCIVVHHMLSHAQNEPMPTGDALAHASKNKRILAKIVHGAASNTVARLIVKSGLARDLGRVLTFCNMDSAYFGSLANALLKPIELLSYQATLTLANNVVNTSSVLRTPGGSTKAQQSTRHHVSPRKCIVSANQRNEPSAQQQQQAVQEQQTAVVNGNNNTVGIDILNDSIVSDLDASTSGDEEQEVGAHDVAGDTADVGGDVNMISHHPPEAGLDRVEMEEALSFMEYQARQMENDESDMIQFEVPNGADSANARRRRRNQHRSEAALMENMMAGLINGANAQLDASADVVNRGVAAFEDQFLADVASPIVNESIAAAGGAVDDAEFGGEDDEDDEEGDDDTENSADSNEDEGEGVAEMDGDEDNSENEDDERSEDEDDGNGEDDAAEDADDDDDDANEQADIEYGLANNVAIERGDDDYGEGGEDDDSLADEYEDMQEENSFTSEYGEDDDEDDEDDETLIAQAGIAAAGGVGENSLMGNARNVAELYFDQQAFNSVELDELVSSFQNMQQNVASAVGYQQRSHRRLMPMIGAEEAEHLYEAASMPPAGRQWAIRTGGPPLPPLPHQITTHNHLQHHHQQPSRAATNRTFVPATGSPLPLSHPLLMPPRASTSDMDYSSTSGGGGMNSRTMMMNLAHNHPLMESGMTASVELGPMMRDAGGGAPVSTASVHVSDSNGNPVPAAVAQAWAPSLLRLAAGAAGPHHGGNVRIEVVAMRSNGPPQHLASSSSGRSGGGVSANQMHRMVATVQDLNNNQHGSASSSSHRSRAAAPPTAAAASIPPAQSVATNSATLTANNAMETSSDETVPAQQQQHEQTQNREQEQRRSAASVSMLMRMLGFSPAASSPLSSPQDFAGPTIGSGLVNPTPDVLSADAMLLESQMRMPILSRHMPRMNALNEREFMAAVGHDPAVVAAGVLAAPNTASATSQSEMAANYAAIADEAGRNLPLPLQDLYVVNQATTANAASGTVQENSVSVRDMTFGQLLRQQQQRPMIANANSLMMTPDRYLSALTGGMGAVAAMHGRPAPGSVSGVMQNMLAQHDRANVGTNSANISARPTASPTPVALNKLRRATMYSLLRAWSESGWACEAHEYLTIVNMLRPALAMHIIRHKLDFNKRVLTLAAAAATAAAAAAANSASTSSAKSDSAAGFSNAVTTVDVAANIHELPIDAVERDQASQSVEASVVAEHVSADMSSGEQADVATSSAGEGTRESNAPLEQQQRVADFETSGLHNVLNDALRRDSFSSVLRILDAGSTHGDAFVDAFDEDSGGDYPMLSSSVLAGLVGHSAASSFPLSAIVARENAAEPVLVNAPERDQGSLSDHVWAADSDAVVVSVPVCDAASSSAMETDQHVPEDSGEIAQNSADLSSSETDYEALQAELTARHARIANAVAESQASLDALRAQQAMLASVVTDALMAQRDDAVENATAGEGPASSMQLAESSNIGEPQQVSDSPVPASASSVQPMSITSDDTNTSSTSTAENVMSEQQPQVNDDVVMTPAASASTAFSSGADTAAAATAPPVVLDNPDNEIPDELPAEFLRELPEDMRNELVSQHRRTVRLRDERRRRAQEQAQRQQAAAQAAETSGTAAGGGDSGASSTAAAMPDVSEVDPEILAQLPPEIQEEVLAQQRAAAAARQERENIAAGNSSASGGSGGAAGSSTASDPAAFFSTLAPDLRRQVLMDMDDSQLTTLPENLRQEAQQLRRSNPRRFAHTQEEMLARLEAEQQALEQAAAGVGRARRMVASIANAAGLPSSSATAGGRYRAYALASAAGASGQLAMLGPSFSPEDAARLAEDGVITTEEFNNWYLASNPNSSSRLTAPPSSLSVSAQLNSIRQRASGGSGRSHVGTETAFALPPPSNQRLSAPTAPREFPGQQRRNVGFLPPTPILNNASQSPLPTSKPVFGRQVFDLEGLTCLTMILTACSSMSADNLDLARLQRILRNLCLHGPTRQFVISSLVSLLDKCGQSSHEALSANAGKNRMKLKWLSLRSNTSNSTSNNSSAGGNEMMATEDNDLTTSTAVAGGEQSTSADSPQSKPTTMFTVCNPIENDGVGIKFSSSAEILFAVQPEAASFLCQLLLGTLNFLAQHFPDALLPLVITRNFNLRTCNIAAPPALRSNAEGVTDSDGNLLGLKPVMSSSSMSPVSPLKQQQQLHGRHQINRRGARGAPAPPLASNDMSFRSAAAGLQQQQKQPESMWDIALRIESCHHGQQFNDDRDNTAGNAVEQVTRHSTVLVPQVPVQMQLLLANDISSTNARAASNIHSNNTPFVAPASRQPPPPSKQVTADNEFFDSLIPFQYPLVQSVSMTDSPVAHIIRLLNQPLARTGSDGVTDAVFRCCKMLFGSLKQREVVVPMRASALVAHLERSQKSLATRKTALSLLSSRHQQQAAAAAAKPKVNATTQASETAATTLASVASGDNAIISNSSPAVHPAADPQPVDEKQAIVPLMLTASSSGVVMPERNTFADLSSLLSSTKSEHMARWTQVVPERLFIHPDVLDSSNAARNHSMTSAALSECFSTVVSAYAGRRARSLVFDGSQRARKALLSNENSQNNVDDEQETVVSGLECLIEPFEFASMRQPAVDERENSTLAAQCVDALQKIADRIGLQAYSTRAIMSVKRDEKYTGTSAMRALLSDNERIDVIVKRATREFATERLPETVQHEISPNTGKSSARSLLACLAVELRQTEEISTLLKELMQCFHRQPRRAGQLGLIDACAILGRACEKLGFASRATSLEMLVSSLIDLALKEVLVELQSLNEEVCKRLSEKQQQQTKNGTATNNTPAASTPEGGEAPPALAPRLPQHQPAAARRLAAAMLGNAAGGGRAGMPAAGPPACLFSFTAASKFTSKNGAQLGVYSLLKAALQCRSRFFASRQAYDVYYMLPNSTINSILGRLIGDYVHYIEKVLHDECTQAAASDNINSVVNLPAALGESEPMDVDVVLPAAGSGVVQVNEAAEIASAAATVANAATASTAASTTTTAAAARPPTASAGAAAQAHVHSRPAPPLGFNIEPPAIESLPQLSAVQGVWETLSETLANLEQLGDIGSALLLLPLIESFFLLYAPQPMNVLLGPITSSLVELFSSSNQWTMAYGPHSRRGAAAQHQAHHAAYLFGAGGGVNSSSFGPLQQLQMLNPFGTSSASQQGTGTAAGGAGDAQFLFGHYQRPTAAAAAAAHGRHTHLADMAPGGPTRSYQMAISDALSRRGHGAGSANSAASAFITDNSFRQFFGAQTSVMAVNAAAATALASNLNDTMGAANDAAGTLQHQPVVDIESYGSMPSTHSGFFADLQATTSSAPATSGEQNAGAAASTAATSASNSAANPNHVLPIYSQNNMMTLITFAERHKTLINEILRYSSVHITETPFAVLISLTRVLDFDVKRRFFRQQLDIVDRASNRASQLSRMGRFGGPDVVLRVRRGSVFEDSFRDLHRRGPDGWRSRFYIIFDNEEGQDAGGLLREWYTIMAREIFNPMYGLFKTSPGDRATHMINAASYINSNHLSYFKFVGRFIGKAILDNKLLDCFFTRSFYKHILGKPVRYTDMESEDPDFYNGLLFLLTHKVSELGYDLTFSTEVQEYGVTQIGDLKPNGRNLPVTDDSKHEYVPLVCQMKMTHAIKQQLKSFLEGFYELIPNHLISMFNEQELELLISGMPNIDVDDLRNNTDYHRYDSTSPQIIWFWQALKSFQQDERAKFLQFVTGTSKVPLQGFAALEGMNGTQKLQIFRDDRGNDRLPCAHTCFNQLDLPPYESYDKLRQMLLYAVNECSEGFGFA